MAPRRGGLLRFRSRSFVPGEDVVGYPPQLRCVSGGFGEVVKRLRMRLGRKLTRPLEAVKADVGEFAMSLVASARLAEPLVASGHVEDVVDDLEENAQLAGK